MKAGVQHLLMKEVSDNNRFYLAPGNIFVSREEYQVTTILGSCVSVCLWDPVLRAGGINHFMLPLWNGEGLASPRYGNIAMQKLIDRMINLGAERRRLQAKVFGGGDVIAVANTFMNIGERNAIVANDLLEKEGVQIIAKDVGGTRGRKIIYNTSTNEVLLKRLAKQVKDIVL